MPLHTRHAPNRRLLLPRFVFRPRHDQHGANGQKYAHTTHAAGANTVSHHHDPAANAATNAAEYSSDKRHWLSAAMSASENPSW